MEIWHEVPGYDGWYDVSNHGRVRSWRWPGNPRVRAGVPRMLTPGTDDSGHAFAILVADNRPFYPRVSRLVLTTFVGEPPPGAHAVHRDGDITNDFLGNLYWGSTREARRVRRKKPVRPKTGAPRAKLSPETVARMREEYAAGGVTFEELGTRYGVTRPTAWRAVRGQSWKEK